MQTHSREFSLLLRLLGVAYAIGAVVFLFFPSELLYLVNIGPKVLRMVEAVPDGADMLWNLWAAAFWATLAVVTLFASSPKAASARGYLLIHQWAKVMMVGGATYLFLNSHRYFAYIVIGMFETFFFVLVLFAMFFRRGAPREA